MVKFRPSPRGAFTLVELLVVIVIIGILVALVLPNIPALTAKAEGVICAGRLRTLWTAFSNQLNDGNAWPQIPAGTKIGSIEEQQWWLTYSSNNLGLTAKDWNCPTILRTQSQNPTNGQKYLISYLPTLFDAKPMSPKSWPRMPWFTESQALHGGGMLSVRGDGSVCPIQDK